MLITIDTRFVCRLGCACKRVIGQGARRVQTQHGLSRSPSSANAFKTRAHHWPISIWQDHILLNRTYIAISLIEAYRLIVLILEILHGVCDILVLSLLICDATFTVIFQVKMQFILFAFISAAKIILLVQILLNLHQASLSIEIKWFNDHACSLGLASLLNQLLKLLYVGILHWIN